MVTLIVLLAAAALVLVVVARTIRIVAQARVRVIERFGRYQRTLSPGLALVVPLSTGCGRCSTLREQVVSFSPQPVITEDNLVVNIDTVIYFQVTDAKGATYEVATYIQAIEQLKVTTLRNVIGGIALEKALTSRDQVNRQLRGVLDEATGKWGIRVNRVELKAIDPPASIQESMEKQMRADREKRPPSSTPKASSKRRSSKRKARNRARSCEPKATGSRKSSAPKGRPRRSRRCSLTSISRCCRRSLKATRTSYGSSRASSRMRSPASKQSFPPPTPTARLRSMRDALTSPAAGVRPEPWRRW